MAAAQAQEAKVITNKGDNKSKIKKIALISFAIITLVIIAEVAYLIFGNNGVPFLNLGKQGQQEESERSFINLVNPKRTPAPTEPESVTFDRVTALTFIDNLDNLARGDYLQPSDIVSLYFEFTGTVLEVGKGDNMANGIEYHDYIKIEKSNGNQVNFWFSVEEVEDARIVLNTSPESIEEISFTDILPGDTITLKETHDLLDADLLPGLLLEIQR